MIKQYNFFKTAKKTARENNLTPAESIYYSGNDLFYDFSLLDDISFSDNDREIITKDHMNLNSITWYEKPMPTIICADNFTHFVGQIETAIHRVYNKTTGKRTMIIVEVISINIEKKHRTSVYNDFETVTTYTARNYNTSADFEI